MRHRFEPAAASDSASAIFHRAPLIGFTVGSTFVPFVMTRDGPRPNDWGGGRKRVTDEIAGSSRVLTQDLGAGPLRLSSGLLFRNRSTFQQFWALIDSPGTLRMNAEWTVWTPDRTRHEGGVDYAEFDDVEVAEVGAPTFDLGKRPQVDVVFQRRDRTWDE